MNTKQSLMVHDAIRAFNSLYDKLYEGDIREESWQVDEGDKYLRYPSLKPFLHAFVETRQDFLSSDREVNAFYLLTERLGGWRRVAKDYRELGEEE